jgi:V8-like Glu-specific endopeptidase
MMITDKGHLYAAPPGTEAAGHASYTAAAAAAAVTSSSSTPATVSSPSSADQQDQQEKSELGGRRRLQERISGVGRRLMGIFGQDSRQEVVELPGWPWSPVGQITFESVDSGYRYQCSGSMIGPFTVITAAHCVVSRTGMVQLDWQFTPAQTSKHPSGLGTATGKRMYFNSNYLTEDWAKWDIGIMVVDMAYGAPDVASFKSAMAEAVNVQSLNSTLPLTIPVPPVWTARAYGYAAQPAIVKTKLFSVGYPGEAH